MAHVGSLAGPIRGAITSGGGHKDRARRAGSCVWAFNRASTATAASSTHTTGRCLGDKQDVQTATLVGEPCIISQMPREHVFRALHIMRKGLRVTTLSGRQCTVSATFTRLCYGGSLALRSLINRKVEVRKAWVDSTVTEPRTPPRHNAPCMPSSDSSPHNEVSADELSGADTPPSASPLPAPSAQSGQDDKRKTKRQLAAASRYAEQRGPRALLTRRGLLFFHHNKPPAIVQGGGVLPDSAAASYSADHAPSQHNTPLEESNRPTESLLTSPTRGRQIGGSTGPKRGRLTDPSYVPTHDEATKVMQELMSGQNGEWITRVLKRYIEHCITELIHERFAKTARRQPLAEEPKPAAAPAVAVRHHR